MSASISFLSLSDSPAAMEPAKARWSIDIVLGSSDGCTRLGERRGVGAGNVTADSGPAFDLTLSPMTSSPEGFFVLDGMNGSLLLGLPVLEFRDGD